MMSCWIFVIKNKVRNINKTIEAFKNYLNEISQVLLLLVLNKLHK